MYSRYETTITSQCPSGKNAIIITRSGLRVPAKRFSLWKKKALLEVNKIKKPIDKPCHLLVRYWSGDKRRRDVSGILDALFHLLEKASIVSDDALLGGFNHSVTFLNRGLDRENPRVEISIMYEN